MDSNTVTGAQLVTSPAPKVTFADTASTGTVTITAASTTDNNVKATLTITVTGDPRPITGVTVSEKGGRNSVMVGNGGTVTGFNLRFKESYVPAVNEVTSPSVTWSVSAHEDGTGSAAAIAVIDSVTGVLTAEGTGTAYVFATLPKENNLSGTADDVVSTPFTVTVTAFNKTIWKWEPTDTALNFSNANDNTINGKTVRRLAGQMNTSDTSKIVMGTGGNTRFAVGSPQPPVLSSGTGTATSGTIILPMDSLI